MIKISRPPIVTFLRILFNNGRISISRLFHLMPWVIKFIFLEPFRIIELLLYNTKLSQYKIKKDPIFILGYYRSGTTYLQRLFIQDKRLGYQSVFHTSLPELMLGFEKIVKPVLSFITRTLKIENRFHKVPFRWDFPGEEDVALIALGIEHSANWGNIFPKHLLDYYEKYVYFNVEERTCLTWKENYLYWIKKLSLKNKGRQLVLKSPPNTARIKFLLELFPNAKFVCIQRNPYDVYASSKIFWDLVIKLYALQTISESEVRNVIVESFAGIMDRYEVNKHLIPKGNLVEVSYEDLSAHPFKVFKNIYNTLKIGDFNLCKKEVEVFIETFKNYKSSRYTISEKDKLLLEEKWRNQIENWKAINNNAINFA